MKFKKRKGNRQVANSTGFRTNVLKRKQQRKEERKQKKKARSVYAARHKKRTTSDSGGNYQKAEDTPNKIKRLKAFVDAEKKKLKVEKKSDEARSKAPNNAGNVPDKHVSHFQEEESEGFKASSSASDRMARLQEFVNHEAGIGRMSDKKSKNKVGPESKQEEKKGSSIKDKQKLKSLQWGLKEDTKEINKLARLLGYKANQKKKIAPIFANDFGGLLNDIEEGSMANAEKYEKDENDVHDSDEDFEKDMAIALGQLDEQKKGKIKDVTGVDTDVENVSKDFMNDDFQAFESGLLGEDEEEDESDGDYDHDSTDNSDDLNDEEASRDDDLKGCEVDDGHSVVSASRREQGDLDDFESTFSSNSRSEYLSSPIQDTNVNDSDVSEASEDENDNSGFLDSQAEECSDEESDSDEELIHDFRTEYELAFEGGSSYCSKPEILKNGQENDIDRYSSNSDDDIDLEGFVVDDNVVEFENVRDELPDELSDSSPVKKRRLIVSDDSEDSINEDDCKENENLDSKIPGDVDNAYLIPRNNSDVSKKIRTRKQQNPKRKRDIDVRYDINEQEREANDCVVNKSLVSNKTKEEKNTVVSSSSEEDEECELKQKRKKIRKRTSSDGEDSDCLLKKSSKKQIRTILKKQSNLKNSRSLSKHKRTDRVSFLLPNITEDESSQNERNYDHVKDSDQKTKGEKTSLHTRKRMGKFMKIPDVSDDDSDNDAEDTDQFDKEENESLDSSEFSDDGNESLDSAKFSEDEDDSQGSELGAVSEMQSSSHFIDNEENESLGSTGFTDEENQSLGSAEFSDDGEDTQGTSFSGVSEMHDNAQFKEDEESESLGSAEFSKDENDSFGSAEFSDVEEDTQDVTNKAQPKEKDGVREDIYGRLRDKEGNIIQDENREAGNGRYIPPALRKLMALDTSEKKKEQLGKLRKTLKGLLNRLAESNMAGIVSQIEGMYIKQSHNDMNEILTSLFFESLVAPTLTPERLVQEHAVLVAVLSTNVGNEVGAHILNEFVLRWNDEMQQLMPGEDIDTKELDNLLLFLASLYNFRVMNARLIYDILNKLAHSFTDKEVELILLILRSVGFTLRKEDPLALKSLITKIQTQASMTEDKHKDIKEYSRVRFMLEVIQAIRNNNMAKMPNFDPSHAEHLKKVLKGLMRKGSQAAQLNITLEDLLKAREHGRWWIVGSAWSGEKPTQDQNRSDNVKEKNLQCEFSEKFKEKAAKLQLSRPPRINILYVITEGSDDYLDAFEKLLQLNLPPQQERELFNVILLCCQKCKVYNPFFAYLADRMCNFDVKYKRLLQFALWDKFEEIESIKPREAANLAKFVTHLIGENSLNLSVFKNISFMEIDSQMISFLRQVLIALLLHPAGKDSVERIFSGLFASPKLRLLRQSLRIFILKFLNAKKNNENADHLMLSKRIQDVTEILNRGGGVRL